MNRALAAVLIGAALLTGCGPAKAPPAATAPRYPDFALPMLDPPDPAQANLVRRHEAAWRWFQTGDLVRAERDLQAVLKRSPQFYPSEAALAYLDLARGNHEQALERFDRVVQARSTYVSALVGKGEALLALSRNGEALAAFEAALKVDANLVEIGRRVEVLRARAAQENVAAARRAAAANRLDEAAQLYEKAIAASPESAFLIRDLADIESKQGKPTEALARYRRAIELDPSDAASRMRVGEILDAAGDLEGALKAYNEAGAVDANPEIGRRISAIEARLAYLRLPEEYRAIPDSTSITRGQLASLIAIRLEPLLAEVPANTVLITDTRNHWAANWIMTTAGAGVLEPYVNHTFQPDNEIRRGDLAQAVGRILKLVAVRQPELLKDWQSRQQKMADVGVSNLNYADASLSVAAGILTLTPDGLFQLSRPVTGAEAIDAISRLERLRDTTK